MPNAKLVEAWSKAARPGFRFAPKLYRGITHTRRWDDPETPGLLRDFFAAVSRFPETQRGPLLLQLPPQAGPDLARLDDLLQSLEEAMGSQPWRVAVEVRNDGWLTQETSELLESHDAALVVHDMAGRGASRTPNNVGFAYVRRHGPLGRYQGSYDPEALAHDAHDIQSWLNLGRDVFVYYNNDRGGNAWRNALSLRVRLDALEQGKPLPRPAPRPERRGRRGRALAPPPARSAKRHR